MSLQHPAQIHSRLVIQLDSEHVPQQTLKNHTSYRLRRRMTHSEVSLPSTQSLSSHSLCSSMSSLGSVKKQRLPLPAASRAVEYRPLSWQTKREGEPVFSRMEPPDKLSNLKRPALDKHTHEQYKPYLYIHMHFMCTCMEQ